MKAKFFALLCLSAYAQAEFQSAFEVGETLTFRIRCGMLTGGYSTLSVPRIQLKDGRPAYHIVSEAKSTAFVDTFYKVRDFNQAWLDVDAPRSFGYEKNLQEGKYRVQEQVRFDHTAGKFYLEKERLDKNKHTEKEGPIPTNVLDILSSFYVMRGQALEVGKAFSIDVHSGSKTWPLRVLVKRREKVSTKAGRFDTFLLVPEMREEGIFLSKGKNLEIWVTSDERRMPVQMRAEIFIGSVTAELVKAELNPAASQVAAHAREESSLAESAASN